MSTKTTPPCRCDSSRPAGPWPRTISTPSLPEFSRPCAMFVRWCPGRSFKRGPEERRRLGNPAGGSPSGSAGGGRVASGRHRQDTFAWPGRLRAGAGTPKAEPRCPPAPRAPWRPLSALVERDKPQAAHDVHARALISARLEACVSRRVLHRRSAHSSCAEPMLSALAELGGRMPRQSDDGPICSSVDAISAAAVTGWMHNIEALVSRPRALRGFSFIPHDAETRRR